MEVARNLSGPERVTVIVAGNAEYDHDVDAETETEIIARAATGDEAIALVLAELPDVLVLDTRITDRDARGVCRRIREWAPATRVLAVSERDDEAAYTTLVAGAVGVITFDIDSYALDTAVTEIARGEAILLPRMATRLLHDLDAWAERAADPLFPPPTLTATEREVLTQRGLGVDTGQIAEAHSVTTHLVNLHAGFAVTKLHRYVLGAERIAAEG